MVLYGKGRLKTTISLNSLTVAVLVAGFVGVYTAAASFGSRDARTDGFFSLKAGTSWSFVFFVVKENLKNRKQREQLKANSSQFMV